MPSLYRMLHRYARTYRARDQFARESADYNDSRARNSALKTMLRATDDRLEKQIVNVFSDEGKTASKEEIAQDKSADVSSKKVHASKSQTTTTTTLRWIGPSTFYPTESDLLHEGLWSSEHRRMLVQSESIFETTNRIEDMKRKIKLPTR